VEHRSHGNTTVDGDFGFIDSADRRFRGKQKLIGELTLREGKVVWDLNGMNSEDWDRPANSRRH